MILLYTPSAESGVGMGKEKGGSCPPYNILNGGGGGGGQWPPINNDDKFINDKFLI